MMLNRGINKGIFAGSGIGKSVLLGDIANSSDADVNVVALIGERGREVREFLEENLGPHGLARSVVVVATSDSPPIQRVKAAFVAVAIADSSAAVANLLVPASETTSASTNPSSAISVQYVVNSLSAISAPYVEKLVERTRTMISSAATRSPPATNRTRQVPDSSRVAGKVHTQIPVDDDVALSPVAWLPDGSK